MKRNKQISVIISIFIGIGFLFMPGPTEYSFMVCVVILITAIVVGTIAYFIVLSIVNNLSNKLNQNHKQIISKSKIRTHENEGIIKDLEIHQNACEEFSKMENSKLVLKYKEFEENDIQNMERYSLETELISRGLIKSGKMTEKLNNILKNM
jgi:hypothetical protein